MDGEELLLTMEVLVIEPEFRQGTEDDGNSKLSGGEG
jgi:hypothetical protein